jgi:hypothetical protein
LGTFEFISWWERKKVQNARVLVVGAGALGNDVIKNLALMGVGHLFIVDFDTIEAANLSRSVLFRDCRNLPIQRADTTADPGCNRSAEDGSLRQWLHFLAEELVPHLRQAVDCDAVVSLEAVRTGDYRGRHLQHPGCSINRRKMGGKCLRTIPCFLRKVNGSLYSMHVQI